MNIFTNSRRKNGLEMLCLRTMASLLCCAFVFTSTYAQSSESSELTDQFDEYRKAGIQEKLYAHTDKNYYAAGETVWIKLYNVDATFNKPISISKVAYTELLDKDNNPVLQAKLALNNGSAKGSLFLPVDIASGNYKLRCYTNWMKNNGAEYFFEKNITVVNTQQLPEISTIPFTEKLTAHFFPEGGNLVYGLKSRLAYKITGANGLGKKAKGVIKDEKNEIVTTFETLHHGIGTVSFTPVSGHQYTAEIVDEKGLSMTQPLPAIQKSGFVMSVDKTANGNLEIKVQSTNDNPQQDQSVYLFAHTRNAIKYVEKKNLAAGVANFSIDENNLGEGITHITIFNHSKQPICERLYFKYPAHTLDISINSNKNAYQTRDKIQLELSATVDKKSTPTADVSVSVYQLDSLRQPDNSPIESYLLLSADLAGHVENPSYYFSNNPETVKAMDNLMLVHGWRRFNWTDILSNKKPIFTYPPEYNGHRIHGKIIKNATTQLQPDMMAYLTVPGTRTQFYNSLSDSAGKIMFEARDFYGSSGIIVQTNYTQNDSNYHVEIDNPFSEVYSKKQLSAFTFPSKNTTTLYQMNLSSQVQNAYFGKYSKQYIDHRVDSATFYTFPNNVYPLDKYTRFTTFEEVLREYVMQVVVRLRGGEFHLSVLDDANKFSQFTQKPLILLDGLPIFNHNKLMQYDPLKTRKLEIVTRQFYYGNESYDGILNFVTYDGNLPDFELDTRATVIDYEALQLEREFYSPFYDAEHQVDTHLPDFRSTLYWKSTVPFDKDGKSTLTFYSGDIKGKFLVVAQGLNADGVMGTTHHYINVE